MDNRNARNYLDLPMIGNYYIRRNTIRHNGKYRHAYTIINQSGVVAMYACNMTEVKQYISGQ